ncbi:AAA family ATPase [Spirillospora sp. NPDC048911]|uniref:AAA family ATPase n=1 Tax=Spirillospora sp. NPDC048911 TaxID=3364527 RepID=UPI003721490D
MALAAMLLPADDEEMATGFVGRAVELGRLAEALRTAGSGVPCIVHVHGAAGIGKTTLVRHFLAAQQGLAVLEASGDENETELPYGVLSQLTGEACPAERDAIAAGAGLLEHLGRLQDDGPVVLVLDDVQWADMLSLSAVTFALRRLRADQVLSIVIARDRAEAALPNGLRRLLQDDRTVRLSLGGLSAADLRAFGGPALSGAAAERLCAFTGGNVLHARELMERLPVGALNDLTRPLPAPHGFAALILARFAACGTHTRDFVGAASVLATPCPVGRIGALAGTEPLAAFEEAAGAGLLEERTTELGLCAAFPHPLVQVAIYQGLGVVARHRFHARATGQVTSELERLHHRVRAAAGPSPELADDLAAFARKEQRTGQWSSAGTHFVQAARLVDEPARRAGLIGEAVGPLVHAGRVEEAAELTRTLPPECPPEVRCFAQGVLAQVAGRSLQATRLLTEAWDRTDTTTDPGLAVRTAEQLAILTMMSSDAAEATKWAERALSATSAGLDTRIVRSVQVLALAALGFPEKALETTAHLPSAQTATPEGRDLLVGRGTVRSWAGDLDGAIGDLAGLLRGADRLSAFQRVVVHAHLGHALHLRGEWDDAVIHGEISTILAEEGDQVWMAGGARGLAALVPAKRGEWATAEHHVAEGHRAAGEILASRFYVAVAEGWLSASRGDSDRVLRVLLPILDLGARNGIDEPGSLDWRDLLSDALLSAGEIGKAEQILEPFERRALDRGRHMSLVRVWRAKGNLLAARQDFSGAAEAFERGVREAQRSPVPFDKAWLDLDYGCFLRRHGSRNAAAERLETAQRTFATLRASPYLERCGRELAACGGAAGMTSRPWNLTAREQAVARLVATGKSNQRTARELMLSVKTIEYHLGHVYAKLGVTNRAELAARFAAGGP